jgi:hypothetical protein
MTRPPRDLSGWLDEYRRFEPDSVVRPVVDSEDDWEDRGLFAASDRVSDETPRWRERAVRVGYGRPTAL